MPVDEPLLPRRRGPKGWPVPWQPKQKPMPSMDDMMMSPGVQAAHQRRQAIVWAQGGQHAMHPWIAVEMDADQEPPRG